MGDDRAEIEAYNKDAEFQDAVDLLVDRHGLEGAERRLLGALSAVRKRMAEATS